MPLLFSLLIIEVSLTLTNSTIQHEFIHALGAYHVQSRKDRDNYVEIVWSNIQAGKEHNFKKHSSALTYGIPYDPLSIMHYEWWSFAKDYSKPTIKSKVLKSLQILSTDSFIAVC